MALTKIMLMHAIGKEAITFGCKLVQFQTNNQLISYGPVF